MPAVPFKELRARGYDRRHGGIRKENTPSSPATAMVGKTESPGRLTELLAQDAAVTEFPSPRAVRSPS